MAFSLDHLTCNYLVNPLGVETPAPRLAWMLSSIERDQRQTAYHVLVASDRATLDRDEGDLWDSGRVESDQQVHVVYEGAGLRPRQTVWWKVRAWDAVGEASVWSAPSTWEMALLDDAEWCGAQWIAPSRQYCYRDAKVFPAPLLRRVFEADKPIRRARVYVSGLGYYEMWINGRRVGDEVLAPAFTTYDVTTQYQTHDITYAVKQGGNAIGVTLGNGHYNPHTGEVWQFKAAPWRDQPKLLLQLHIKYDDGGDLIINSDAAWRGSYDGPIVFDGLRNGETYDARKELPGWTTPGFDEAASPADWQNVTVVPAPGGVIRSQQHTPIRVTHTLTPVALNEAKPGVWVYDLGQNIAGWAQIRVSGPAGTEVVMRYAEKIDEDGDIDAGNINTLVTTDEFQVDRYILRGDEDADEIFEPHFTYHGFQYVQVTGYPGTPTLDSLRGCVVHTDFESRGGFECSNDLVNRIQQATRWATVGNFHGLPTDCPHREKNGWTGDASLSAEQVLFNFDPQTCYTRWMRDFRDLQRPSGQYPAIVPTGGFGWNRHNGPAWDSASLLIPWAVYLYCGDTALLREHYESMRRYVDYMTSMATEHLLEFGLGDWCPPTGGAAGHACPITVTSTAYYYVDARIVADVAKLLGHGQDAARFSELAGRIRAAFREKLYDPETGVVAGQCQTSQGTVLYQGLADEADTPKALAKLVEYIEAKRQHLDFGILGAQYVMNALADLGHADLAFTMATQRDFPGWGHWIELGATTLWESWNGDASRNHHMFGDISAWFYKTLAGIRPVFDQPGFKHTLIQPHPVGDLTWVKAWHRSMFGLIVSHWTRDAASGMFTLNVTIPPNTTATVALPTSDPASVREGDRTIEGEACDGRVRVEIGSGDYTFSCSR